MTVTTSGARVREEERPQDRAGTSSEMAEGAEGGVNAYEFCGNNPLMFSDPSGLFFTHTPCENLPPGDDGLLARLGGHFGGSPFDQGSLASGGFDRWFYTGGDWAGAR